MTILLETKHKWYCPKCKKEDVTFEANPHVKMHTCPRFYGMTTPMVAAGVKADLVAVERQDYEGKDSKKVQRDDRGRPIMSIITKRDNGQDAVVYAPVATGSSEG